MPGLVPGIHVLTVLKQNLFRPQGSRPTHYCDACYWRDSPAIAVDPVPSVTAPAAAFDDLALARTVDGTNPRPGPSTTGARTMKRIIGIVAVAIALNGSAILSAQAMNTTPLNYLGQPVSSQPVAGTLGRNTTISSSINPGATSIRATTLQIHPSYTPPVPTTVGTGTLGRNTTISSSINPTASSITATTLQIHPNYTPPVPATPLNTFGQP